MAGRTLSEFYQWALMPWGWAHHARCLYQSAELLFQPLQRQFDIRSAARREGTVPRDHPDFDADATNHKHAYLLLSGCAIETMLKAAAIQRALNKHGPRAVLENRPELQGWLTSHDLETLAKRAGLSLTPSQRMRLQKFTEFVVWAGRYPTPKKFKTPTDEPTPDLIFQKTDPIFVNDLFEQAQRAYEREQALAESRSMRATRQKTDTRHPKDESTT
jgi:hypothetical protein